MAPEQPERSSSSGSGHALPSPPDPAAKSSRLRRLLVAFAIYLATGVVFAALAGKERLAQHTDANHFALQADAWLHGHLDLPGGAPAYTGHNDFVEFKGKTFISFPPFPSVVMLPFVKVAGSAENFQDGQFIVWLAGLAPALLFLVLEKLRRTERTNRTERENAALGLLFSFGTVYCFSAIQGDVWYAGHVVAAALICGYLLCALDAEHPLLAGILLGCAFMTRATTLLLAPLLAFEAVRVCYKPATPGTLLDPRDSGLPASGSLTDRIIRVWRGLDRARILNILVFFALPILFTVAVASRLNKARYGDPNPTAFGHEHLSVYWATRIRDWGLFSYHYLPKNLGVFLTSLPWLPPKGAHPPVPFMINEHGLALWFTTPLYFWLFRPKRGGWYYAIFTFAAILPCFADLLYQNTGWVQFGYRFSNDYSPLLFVLLALGERPMGALFSLAGAWAIAWNIFGAATFHQHGGKFYFREGSADVLYQPDCGSPLGPPCGGNRRR